MKLFLSLLLSFTFFAIIYGSTGRSNVKMDPNDLTICVSDDEDIGRMKIGESKTHPKQCMRLTCGPGVMGFARCGSSEVTAPCTMGPEDPTKPYPDCCPQPVCPPNY